MNTPETHPTLTKIHPVDGSDMDSVFVYVPTHGFPLWNVDMYWNGSYQPISSMKGINIGEARKWWNTLVEKQGYTRKGKNMTSECGGHLES